MCRDFERDPLEGVISKSFEGNQANGRMVATETQHQSYELLNIFQYVTTETNWYVYKFI